MKYDPTKPTSAHFVMIDLGAARASQMHHPLHVIAATGLRAFEFATLVAASQGMDLELVSQENLEP